MESAHVEVDFSLGKDGWGSCRLKIATGEILLDWISYTTDALGDLVRAALAIAAGSSKASCCFDREPAEWRVVLERYSPSELYVRVLEFDGMRDELESAGIQRFNQTCNPDEFCEAVARTAQAVLRMHGTEGYEESWGLPFPAKALAILETAIGRAA